MRKKSELLIDMAALLQEISSLFLRYKAKDVLRVLELMVIFLKGNKALLLIDDGCDSEEHF